MIREFVAELKSRPETDHEIELICTELLATIESPMPLLLELTWYVHCIMYVCADPILERPMRSTPSSLVRAWFVAANEFCVRMEDWPCGKCIKMG